MGIRGGSKGNFGTGGRPRTAQSQSNMPRTTMPPTFYDVGKGQYQPFLNDKEFRLGVFHMLEEHDDYLICKGYDPNGSSPAPRTINVAKPSLLTRTPFDGQTVPLIVEGQLRDVTFEYSNDEVGKRTARCEIIRNEGEDNEEVETIEEIQRITMDYIVGDTIVAVRVRQSPIIEGVDLYAHASQPEYSDADPVSIGADGRLLWVDLNFSGRCWAVSEE